jgi:hypothetical protein
MSGAGFQVEARDVSEEQLLEVMAASGVPEELGSCHTAEVGGYIVEGHVPAATVQRLLRERPRVTGIAVPGMPIGSPGMEQGNRREPYAVYTFVRDGRTAVYERH